MVSIDINFNLKNIDIYQHVAVVTFDSGQWIYNAESKMKVLRSSGYTMIKPHDSPYPYST